MYKPIKLYIMSKLQLEFRNEFEQDTTTFKVGNVNIMVTPPLDDDYWVFRIKLHEDQSLIAFPKFGTLGIGFAQENNWNTNLPYQCTTKDIYNHIKENKKYKQITKKKCIEAIEILQKASKYYKENEMPDRPEKVGGKDNVKEYMKKMFDFIM